MTETLKQPTAQQIAGCSSQGGKIYYDVHGTEGWVCLTSKSCVEKGGYIIKNKDGSTDCAFCFAGNIWDPVKQRCIANPCPPGHIYNAVQDRCLVYDPGGSPAPTAPSSSGSDTGGLYRWGLILGISGLIFIVGRYVIKQQTGSEGRR